VAVRVIGLDIGTTHVRAAEVEHSGRGPGSGHATLLKYAELALPAGAVSDGEVKEVATVASTLKRLWSKGHFSHRNVVSGVGNGRTVVREMQVPSLPLPQVRQSLPFQTGEMLPMSTDEALLDFYPTSEEDGDQGGKMLRGILVAISKATVSQHVAAIESAGLTPQMVDLNAFALYRAQAVPDWGDQTVAFVDIGARTTSVLVASTGLPRLVRILPAGGSDVTEAVAGAMKSTTQEAEQTKRQIGIGFAVDPSLKPGADALAITCRALVDAIRNTFVFYSQNNASGPIQHVALTGGGSHLPGLGQFLASAVRLPVSFGDGLSRVKAARSLKSTTMEGRESLLAVSVGLAFAEVGK
jgi:type IV pilus assembly protein PilM